MIEFGKLYKVKRSFYLQNTDGDDIIAIVENSIVIPLEKFYEKDEDSKMGGLYEVTKILYLNKILKYYFCINSKYSRQNKLEERIELHAF